MKGGCATGDCAGVRRVHKRGKLAFKGGNLWALRDPAGKNRSSGSRYFFLPKVRTRDWNKVFRHGLTRREAPSCGRLPAPIIPAATCLDSRTNREDERVRRRE